MVNPIKILKDFIKYCKEVFILYYGKHFINVLGMSVFLCLFLTMFYQESVDGSRIFLGLCVLVVVIFFNGKAYKGKNPEGCY